MKFARFASAGLSGALALMTMNLARAEVVTIAPDGSVERSENAAPPQQPQVQNAPVNDLATPEAAAGMNGYLRERQRGNVVEQGRVNRNDRDDRGRDERNDNRYHVPRGRDIYVRPGSDVTIIGDNTDVYIGGRPGYGYGYPVGGYPYCGYPGYGYPYGGYDSYYGGTVTYGGVTVTYGNGYGNGFGNSYQSGQTTIIAGQPGMQPAWPNMQPANGMGAPFANAQPQPRLPVAIYNHGRR